MPIALIIIAWFCMDAFKAACGLPAALALSFFLALGFGLAAKFSK
jgi:hypothetical protein